MKRIALGIGIGLLIAALPGHGHVLPHKKNLSLQERKDFQERVIWHDKSVIRFYSRRPTTSLSRSLQFHKAQLAWTQRELRETLSALARLASPSFVIAAVFGPYAAQALRVAWCESRWSVRATNGQYLGLFQMGSYARSRYGDGEDAWSQARAAWRYFVDSGRDWSPWSCKP